MLLIPSSFLQLMCEVLLQTERIDLSYLRESSFEIQDER